MRRSPLVVVGMGTTIALAVLSGVAVPEIGHAQMLKCASRDLDRDDRNKLKAAARALVPRSEVLVMGACRNPGRALGFVETDRTFTPERIKQWWTLSCARKEQNWTCDPPEFKQSIKLSLRIGNAVRHVALGFDHEIPLDRAKSLISQAMTLYADPKASLESCSPDRSEDQRWQAMHLQYRRQFELGPIHATVHREGGHDTVTLHDIFVDFRFPINADDAAESPGVCWLEFIVVT